MSGLRALHLSPRGAWNALRLCCLVSRRGLEPQSAHFLDREVTGSPLDWGRRLQGPAPCALSLRTRGQPARVPAVACVATAIIRRTDYEPAPHQYDDGTELCRASCSSSAAVNPLGSDLALVPARRRRHPILGGHPPEHLDRGLRRSPSTGTIMPRLMRRVNMISCNGKRRHR